MDKPDVFMPLYIGDYLAGTSRLSTELHGAYLLLIMDYWMNGPLPDNNAALASIVRMSPDAWSIARASLEYLFSIENGVWKHKRIEKELVRATEKKAESKAKAVKAAAARWGKQNNDAPSNAPSTPHALLEECPSPSPSPSPSSLKDLNTLVICDDAGINPEKQIPEKNKSCPTQKIIDLYHEVLPELPKMVVISEQRKSLIQARWNQNKSMQDLGQWRDLFELVRESDFLMGKVEPRQGEKRFVADLEFLTTASKFPRLVEGKYHDRK